MLFVVDKPRLQRIIAITRDDRRPKDQSTRQSKHTAAGRGRL